MDADVCRHGWPSKHSKPCVKCRRERRNEKPAATQLADLVLAVEEGLALEEPDEEYSCVEVDPDDWRRLVELATKAGGDAKRGHGS